MGNQLCCEEDVKKEFDHTITVVHKQESVKVPEVNAIIAQHLEKKSTPRHSQDPSTTSSPRSPPSSCSAQMSTRAGSTKYQVVYIEGQA